MLSRGDIFFISSTSRRNINRVESVLIFRYFMIFTIHLRRRRLVRVYYLNGMWITEVHKICVFFPTIFNRLFWYSHIQISLLKILAYLRSRERKEGAGNGWKKTFSSGVGSFSCKMYDCTPDFWVRMYEFVFVKFQRGQKSVPKLCSVYSGAR